MKIEKRKPWPRKVPVTDFYVPGLRFFLIKSLRPHSVTLGISLFECICQHNFTRAQSIVFKHKAF